MIFHILNGDSLAYSFPATKLPGEVVVFGECLIEGDLSGNSLTEFWKTRAHYLAPEHPDDYYQGVVTGMEKIMTSADGAEFNLWFEYDLFCQVNMWFILSVINKLPISKKVYAVYTSYLKKGDRHFWNGFGPAKTDELLASFDNRIILTGADLQFGKNLWQAYKSNDLEELRSLSNNQSPSFPNIKEVIQAHIERFPQGATKGRPERVLEEIIQSGTTDLHQVFEKFWNKESIYGFGDVQLKRIYDKVIHS